MCNAICHRRSDSKSLPHSGQWWAAEVIEWRPKQHRGVHENTVVVRCEQRWAVEILHVHKFCARYQCEMGEQVCGCDSGLGKSRRVSEEKWLSKTIENCTSNIDLCDMVNYCGATNSSNVIVCCRSPEPHNRIAGCGSDCVLLDGYIDGWHERAHLKPYTWIRRAQIVSRWPEFSQACKTKDLVSYPELSTIDTCAAVCAWVFVCTYRKSERSGR